MTSALLVPSPTSLPVAGSPERFFVHRVYCVGRNYADHAREMGNDPDREPPFFFAKPADAIFAVDEGVPARHVAPHEVPYPPQTHNLHFEMELVVAIGRGGSDIEPHAALDHVWGYGAGVDLTRRDLQDTAKSLRRPWDLSKGFDFSAPCTPLVPASGGGHPASARIWLNVDDEPKQMGDLADQIWAVPDIVAALSRSVTLLPGDVIFTGTPAGVGALVPGNVVTGGIDGIGELSFRVV
ncbi:fumarylacetoacetate hydrolase family protein [Cryobacterium sp. CG_9.6]|uniref:fumarylacetoacetate hydrolase family protein n=1 Tax=Cryobacterium sp. CG_9.6 TaxID=2760710 RepID=UPI002474F990|nr:fumarylacetoacetate hydrolase family protein [Cryobacterium sp. CG_9.6]MDH6235305.1 fumarylpyruvate hydrolase [Cryobacterium sp. CG_9.6]